MQASGPISVAIGNAQMMIRSSHFVHLAPARATASVHARASASGIQRAIGRTCSKEKERLCKILVRDRQCLAEVEYLMPCACSTRAAESASEKHYHVRSRVLPPPPLALPAGKRGVDCLPSLLSFLHTQGCDTEARSYRKPVLKA